MPHKFSELEAKMSPGAKRRSEALALTLADGSPLKVGAAVEGITPEFIEAFAARDRAAATLVPKTTSGQQIIEIDLATKTVKIKPG